MRFSNEINQLSAIELFNHGTVELSSGVFPDKDTFCGQCWIKLKEEKPGERIIDWKFFKEDIISILECLDYYKADKKHDDYIFLQRKLIECEISEKGYLKDGLVYTDLEITALYLKPNGNRLEIPKDFVIGNYKELKKVMSNFGGVYKKNGFDFKYPAINVLERISNKETTNLKKTYQFYATPKELSKELCLMTLDPYVNKSVKILEPSAGQGSIVDAIYDWFKNESVHMNLSEFVGIEYMKENYDVLKAKYNELDLINGDFLKYDECINYFDYVIANPPFTKGQDIEHFKKMYEVCKWNGVVTSIMSTSWFTNTGKKYSNFRKWLGITDDNWRDKIMCKEASKGCADYRGFRINSQGNEEEVIIKTYEAGAFKESGTNVITCVVILKKNGLSGFDMPTGQQTLF